MCAAAAPNPDEIELSLFGPGYGECVLIHVPEGDWIIVDSCIDSATKSPAALEYLESIGVDPSVSVKLVVATHWHDDHIRGLSKVVEACKQADLCFSSSLHNEEFIQLSETVSGRSFLTGSSGIDEFHHSLLKILSREKTPIFAGEGSLIWRNPHCQVHALSPSHYSRLQVMLSYKDILPKRLEPKKALVSKIPNINHIAVVLLIEIGDFSILLGSDLEEAKDPRTGWAAIVSSTTRPQAKAAIFKIPHHGSETAHSEDVWDKMLKKNPLALCTPYNRKVILPGKTDVQRIYRYTDNAHITSIIKERKLASKSDSTVEKTIRESGIKFGSFAKKLKRNKYEQVSR